MAASHTENHGCNTRLRRNHRILVVDDDRMLRRMFERILRGRCDVVSVESADAARDILEGDPGFDTVLCDVNLTGMSGIDFHHWLAIDNPELAGRMLFITGGVFTEDARRFLEEIPERCLGKPLDKGDLFEAIDSVLPEDARN